MRSRPVRLTDKPIKILRPLLEAADAKWPGYRDAVLAASTAADDERYVEISQSEYANIWNRFGIVLPRSANRPTKSWKYVKLGDAVERLLSGVGITKQFVEKITRKPCGCPARQKWLNQWGFQKQAQLDRFLRIVARWYGIG